MTNYTRRGHIEWQADNTNFEQYTHAIHTPEQHNGRPQHDDVEVTWALSQPKYMYLQEIFEVGLKLNRNSSSLPL